MLKKIKTNRIPFLDNYFITIGDTCYIPKKYFIQCQTIERFKQWSLPLFLHENEHSKRQIEYGIKKWLFRYITNKRFKWEEEVIGYTIEIKKRIELNFSINRDWYFKTLKSYRMATDNQIRLFLDSLLK
jgi:hypothetical protein